MLKTFKIKNSIKITCPPSLRLGVSRRENLKLKILLTSCILFLISFWASVTPVKAQNQYPEGITVIPSIWHLDLATDPPEYDLKYINNTDSNISLEIDVQDFTGLEEGYKISYLEEKDATNYKYSLSSWLSFENRNLLLAPGEEKSIKVFIDKDRITLGGHYASIMAKAVSENVEREININPVISSLLFVRASTGREIESGEIITFKPDRSLVNFPENFILRFENSGNVHVVPYGQVQITDMFGSFVANGILNEKSLDALPESIRRYDIPIISNSKFMLPGIYTAKIDMHFGKSKNKLTKTTHFFSEGSIDFIKLGFIILVILITALVLRKKKKKKIEKPTEVIEAKTKSLKTKRRKIK